MGKIVGTQNDRSRYCKDRSPRSVTKEFDG